MIAGEFERDAHGFWVAHVDAGNGTFVRYPLAVPFTATREQAAVAFDLLLRRLERLKHEHR